MLNGKTCHQGRWCVLPIERSTFQVRWLPLLVENMMGLDSSSSSLPPGEFRDFAQQCEVTDSARTVCGLKQKEKERRGHKKHEKKVPHMKLLKDYLIEHCINHLISHNWIQLPFYQLCTLLLILKIWEYL